MAPRLPPPPRQLNIPSGQPNTMAPPHNDDLCRKCGQPGHLTINCPWDPSQNVSQPPDGRKKGHRTHRCRNRKARMSAMDRGQVTHVKMGEARESPKIVMGTLSVNSVAASVLFDSGASHSFVSQQFSQRHEHTPLEIITPRSRWQTKMVSHNNQIKIEGLMFSASLIALGPSDIDIILGMDWLTAHNALIDCATKTVQLTHPSG